MSLSHFVRDLLIGEAQPDPYVWAAVLWAHAMIGVVLMATVGALAARWLRDDWAGVAVVASVYAVWEVVQFTAGAPTSDCALDWSAVVIGAVLTLALWHRRAALSLSSIAALIGVCLAGVQRRGP